MATRRRRNHRRGVTLIKPDRERRQSWRARWRDPDDPRRFVKVTLPADLTTEEQREAWCSAKARELRQRREALEGGALRLQRLGIKEAVAAYFDGNQTLRPKTIAGYRESTNRMLRWAAERRIATTDELTIERLHDLATWLTNLPKRSVVHGAGTGRGRRVDSEALRSPVSVNTDLRALATALHWLRVRGKTPKLTKDAIGDGLKRRREGKRIVTFLRPNEIARLLHACAEHDRVMARRAAMEAKRGLPRPRHALPILPFVRFLLLTGVRLNEALSLTWADVNLDDAAIKIPIAISKTHEERVIELEHSPTVVSLLEALPGEHEGPVFAGHTAETVKASINRLVQKHKAPADVTYQGLRRTCCTYLTNADFGGPWKSAKRAGHSVVIAESRYVGLVKIPKDALTLEAAMGIEREPKPKPQLRTITGGRR